MCRSGIIPARAGSTEAGKPVTETFRDHPRSRGEHASSAFLPHIPGGSSPLARGARDRLPDLGGLVRIIPARAGSTSDRRQPAGKCWDHPRSRGEHSTGATPAAYTAGSSPLARGAQCR
ncbi:hypothetical protein A606_11645 [Corynebacterium terpenotabidum Y-11]|uniref:Uncharacterized protein n=1 Tax=Corynebacterium terpenotabidum Y-11 TaxID=1200352 RepID=S4XMS5_9CORY|nr:hypothetical protein A606_11645 [Corynebacterium terpenotabidum Y-11]